MVLKDFAIGKLNYGHNIQADYCFIQLPVCAVNFVKFSRLNVIRLATVDVKIPIGQFFRIENRIGPPFSLWEKKEKNMRTFISV